MKGLIITEKPAAAKKMAEALAEGRIVKKGINKVPYYEITRGGNKLVIGCAVGHLFGLAEKQKKGWTYPVFSVEWKPLYEVDKNAKHARQYIDVLKKICKGIDEYVIACDYDVEGEIIGYNVLRFVCKKKDAKRMQFSTLTRPDLIRAYEEAMPHIDWGQALAGETRHEMDWYYGINLSRALTTSIKGAGMFKILSIGRVQGPALKIIVEREREIKAFRPVPFWQIELEGVVKSGEIIAWHEKDKFWDESEAKKVYRKTKGRDGTVDGVKTEEFRQAPPNPFDLTTLQTEAYRCFGINPKKTLELAQELYTAGIISYPRTSSQQLPPAIGFKSIISKLSRQTEYSNLCAELLRRKLAPNNGKKTDPAHPAIFPTGIVPKALKQNEGRIYDLVVRRFLATFGAAAVRETMTVKVNVESEIFVAKGTRTKEKGWHKYYGPHVNLKEDELPKVNEGEAVKSNKVKLHSKETQPPKRYTPASLIRALEKRSLGTKATRAQVIDTLYQRGYISEKSIAATNLGTRLVETLENYCPKIVDEELTRHFELEMEDIQQKKKKPEEVLEEVRSVLTRILEEFKEKNDTIGAELMEASRETREKENTVGKCVLCEGALMIKKGRFGRFIACSRYPECKATFKLPMGGLARTTDKICKECRHPMILMIRKARKPQEVCINLDCPTKQIKSDKENAPCKKCKKGKLVIRKSVYGQFLACGNFPKCRNIVKG